MNCVHFQQIVILAGRHAWDFNIVQVHIFSSKLYFGNVFSRLNASQTLFFENIPVDLKDPEMGE